MAKPHQPTINRTSRQSLLFPLWQSQSTPRLSSPSLCLSGKGRYLGNTSHLSGNCSCGRSRHKTLGFPSLRVWSLLALPQETSCHQVGVPHQEVWLGMYWKRSSQGLGKREGGTTALLPAAASEARSRAHKYACSSSLVTGTLRSCGGEGVPEETEPSELGRMVLTLYF